MNNDKVALSWADAVAKGGMLSSLVHILIVTPVIFAWLRERELRKELAAME